MTREPVMDAMRRLRRLDLFAAHARLSPDHASRLLVAVLSLLRPFHGRSIGRTTAVEIIREAGCPDPVRFFDAMRRRGFFETNAGRHKVDIAPVSLCEIRPPISEKTADRNLRAAFFGWLEWLFEREKKKWGR